MKKHYIALWLGCLLGGVAVVPYYFYLGALPPSVTMQSFFLSNTVNTAVLFAIVLGLSSLIIPKTDLQPFVKPNWICAVATGVLVGLSIFVLSKLFYQNSIFTSLDKQLPLWSRILASFYGAFNEEVLSRLFLFTLIYFLIGKVNRNRTTSLWGANIIIALLFGLSHLPTAMKLGPLSAFEVSRILLLNGIPALAFGWLYATNGIYAAAIAHFVSDLMVHVFLGV